MVKRVTIKDAKQVAKQLGFTFKKTEYGDYRFNKKGAPEAYAIYTDDLQDAVETMNYIWFRSKGQR